MVKDIIINIKEHDLLTTDKSNASLPMFDSLWGNIFDEDKEIDILICNIIIPEAYWSMVKYENNEMTCRFKSAYMPDTRNFRIRLVGLRDGKYYIFSQVRGDFGLPANSYALNNNIAAPISACMLPYIDIEGEYLVKLIQNNKSEILDKAYLYSAKSSDLTISFSDDQASQLLSLCAPGNYYRYPTTGVGVTRYLNCVIAHSDLQKVLESQFNGDKKPIQDAEFDNETGQLDVIFHPEKEVADTDLVQIEELDINFFDQFSDDFVRKNIVLTDLSDNDFIASLSQYDNILSLVWFKNDGTNAVRIADQVAEGKFNGVGEIEANSEYFIVTATLEADSIIMFDDENEDFVNDSPIFIINDVDESRLYTSLVEQPYWISEECHKCFILKHRAILRYMISKEQFRSGRGLFVIPQTSENLKNMVGVVQDANTGRLLGIVSDSTNISDITLDEITQYIYANMI